MGKSCIMCGRTVSEIFSGRWEIFTCAFCGAEWKELNEDCLFPDDSDEDSARTLRLPTGQELLMEKQSWANDQIDRGDSLRLHMPDFEDTHDFYEIQWQAIEHYKIALKVYTEQDFPEKWAKIQKKIGDAYLSRDDDNNAIQFYNASCSVYTKIGLVDELAEIKIKLGDIYSNVSIGDPAENFNKAIEYYLAALRVYTMEHPSGNWAEIQRKLGNVNYKLTTGNQDENLKRAIEYYTAALSVCGDIRTWYNLGTSYIKISTGDQSENRTQAIRCFNAALQLFDMYDNSDKEHRTEEYANIQLALGKAYSNLTFGDSADKWYSAIKCFEAALTGISYDKRPDDWAKIHYDLGCLYSSPPNDDLDKYQKKAFEHFEAALRIYNKYTKEEYPEQEPDDDDKEPRGPRVETNGEYQEDSARIQYQLGKLYTKRQSPLDAIACFDAALCVITKEESPQRWADIQIDLGRNHFDVKESDYDGNFEGDYLSKHKNEAILCYENALSVFTINDCPEKWAKIQYGLGNVYRSMNTEDQCENQSRAINSYNVALLVYTEQAFEQEWANIQNALGNIFCKLTSGDRHQNQSRAIECFTSALRVLTEKSSPQEWANIQYSLGYVYSTPPTGDQVDNQRRAIEHYTSALRILTAKEKAETQITIGDIFCKLTTEGRRENQIRAIEFYTAALHWPISGRIRATGQLALFNNFNIDLPNGDPSENLSRAIENFGSELRAFFQQNSQNEYIPMGELSILLRCAVECHAKALCIFTETDNAQIWAEIQYNLGCVYSDLWIQGREEYRSQATECYNAALRVYTARDFPEQNKKVLNALADLQPPDLSIVLE